MTAPERIFARLDTSTVYMDGSSPLIARTREFRGGAAYVRADVADETLEALEAALSTHGDQYSWGPAARAAISKA